MRITNRQFLWVILFALAITARAQEQQTNKPVPGDSPLETVKITTNLVVLRVAVSDQQGRATMNLKHFISNRHRLENSILGLRADGETALFDAIDFALDRMNHASNRKKVLVVITDGEDNASRLKFRELIERAEEEEAVIYTVGMFESSMSALSSLMGRSDRDAQSELRKLAEVTGASAHFPSNVDQCKSVMREIAREVSQQYSLGYYPLNKTRDGRWRRIQVKVNESGSHKYVARTRSGYYARKEEPEN